MTLKQPCVYGAVNNAVDYAAYNILQNLYGGKKDLSGNDINFTSELQTALAKPSNASQQDRDLGKYLGEQVSAAMINARSTDNSGTSVSYNSSSTVAGEWRNTGSGTAVTPHWGNVTPFALTSGSAVRPAGPAAATTLSGVLSSSLYKTQVEEVRTYGSANSTARTADQTTLAHFWACDLDTTYKPPGQLFEHTTNVVNALNNLSTFETAKLYALVATAMGDAGVAAWDAKYNTSIDLWRPESAIKIGSSGVVADPNWLPLSKKLDGTRFSPGFPAYISGHATFAGAWAGAMQKYFGTDNYPFTATTDDPFAKGVTRQFSTFSAAARENADSRIYLGVHYRFDADKGLETGYRVADAAFTKLGLRARPAGWWQFNEGSGTTAADFAGGGRNLSLATGTGWTPSPRGNALTFDGAGYASAGGPSVNTNTGLTVAAWVKLDNTDGFRVAVSQDGVNRGGFYLQYSKFADRWTFHMSTEDAWYGSWHSANSSSAPSVGVWTHLAGVYDPAAGKLRIYVNGQLSGLGDHTNAWNATGPLRVGTAKNNGSLSDFWRGAIDDVRTYNRVLSDTEITGLYNG